MVMERLAFEVTYTTPDGGRLGAGGTQTVSLRDQQAFLLAPAEIDPARAYPLVTVLHGAGRQDELIARSLEGEADRRHALFLVPRSWQPTWDLIAGGDGEDLRFLVYCFDAIYRRYRIDPARQALVGYSDGASYGLALGLSNPRVFAAVMAWAAGFLAIDAQSLRDGDPKPRIFLEYGTHDQLFPFDRVALPMKEALERLGYPLTFRADEGGIHWPSSRFQPDALDWFLGAAG
jgi:phospholipase/carboxylesterase